MHLRTFNATSEGEQGSTSPYGKLLTRQFALMPKLRGSKSRISFTTIDDLVPLADELVSGLHQLADYKHPLAVRKASRIRREVRRMDNKDSRQVSGSWRTYFLDIRKTKEDKPRPYLVITESRKAEGGKFERSRVMVFPEDAKEFAKAVSEMAAK